MSVKEELLPLLQACGKDYLSGEDTAKLLGVSRNAVWKSVSSLKNDGYNIEAVTNRGYRLVNSGDVLSPAEIENNLTELKGKLCIKPPHKNVFVGVTKLQKNFLHSQSFTVLLHSVGKALFFRKGKYGFVKLTVSVGSVLFYVGEVAVLCNLTEPHSDFAVATEGVN